MGVASFEVCFAPCGILRLPVQKPRLPWRSRPRVPRFLPSVAARDTPQPSAQFFPLTFSFPGDIFDEHSFRGRIPMYAVAEIAGKQYIVEEGKTVAVDLLDIEEGASIDLDKVCLIRADDGQVKVGQPYVEGALIKARVERTFRARKILVFFYRKRKDSHKRRGHRQYHSLLHIEKIQG